MQGEVGRSANQRDCACAWFLSFEPSFDFSLFLPFPSSTYQPFRRKQSKREQETNVFRIKTMSNNNQEPSHDESLQNLPAGLTDVQLGGGEKGEFSLHATIPHFLYLCSCFHPTKPFCYNCFLTSSGLLAPLGDPVGNALNKGLSPVGTAIGGLTNGGYSKSKEMDKQAEEEKGMGGKEQNGQNPLGL